jgi:serine/threonine protein kinase
MRKVDREAYLNSMREIDIHKQIKHKNIINLKAIIDDSQDDKVYMVMEYAGYG